MISIALCTYNGAAFLEEQLMSILNQSYRNIEVIIVDDCSTDNTNEIIEKIANLHPQIKHFKNEKNLGFNQNFEKAIQLARGDFIAISDQDDVWELNKIESLLNHIGNNWLIFSNSQFIDENGNLIDGQILSDHFALKDRDFKSLLFSNFVTGHTVLFSRDFLNYLLPIPKLGYYDWWMGFVALYHHKIICLNQKLTLHRIHSSSVMYREKEIDIAAVKGERDKEIRENLSILKDYKGLLSKDRLFIYDMYFKYTKNDLKQLSLLIINIFTNYSTYFPDLKKRNLLSRLNYAIKFAFKKVT